MRKHNKWALAIVSALLGISACTTSVQAADNNANSASVTTSQSSSTTSKKVTYNKADYFSSNPKIIRVKHVTTAYKNAALTKGAHSVKAGTHFLTTGIVKSDNQVPVVKTTSGLYIPAKKSLISAVKGYQNPKRYHQVHYTQIKPYGKVGYNLYRGYEGIKTWKVMHRMGTWAGRNYYNQATYNAVKNFQRRHHLAATGNVNLKTWEKMGFSKSS